MGRKRRHSDNTKGSAKEARVRPDRESSGLPKGTARSMNPGLQALEDWFKENGIIHACRMVLDHTGKSVLAAKDLPAGSVVCSVPDITVLLADETPIGTYLCEYDMTHEAEDFELERQGLILALMKERLLGIESRFYPYIQSLQSHNFNLPMTWEQGELRRLKGTSLFDKLFQDPSGFKRHLPYAVKVLQRRQGAESPLVNLPMLSRGCLEAGLPTEEAEAWPLYQWATAVVASFSFTLGDSQYPALVPFWDALNHWTGRVNVAKRHHAEEGMLQLVATQDIAEGEEVVNSYGELSSAELLRRYGFVEPGCFNPYACSEIPASWLVVLCRGAWRSEMKSKLPMLHEKLELMRMFQLLPASGFFKIRADGSLQQQLVECVRLLMMKESDFAAFVAQLPTESSLLRQYEPEAQAAVAAARLKEHLWLCMRTIGTLCLALKRRYDGIAWDAEADGELLSSSSQQQQQQQQPLRQGASNEEQRSIASAVVRHEERSALNAAFRRLSLILITYADEMGASPSSDADQEEDAGAGRASDKDQQIAQMRSNLLALLSSAAEDDGDEDGDEDGEEGEEGEEEDDDAEEMEDEEDGEGDDDAEDMGGEKTPDGDQQTQDEPMDLPDAGEDEDDEVKQILIGLQSCPHQVWKRHLLRWFQGQFEALEDDDDDDDEEDEDYEDGEGNDQEDEEEDDDDNEEEDDDEDADYDGDGPGDEGQA